MQKSKVFHIPAVKPWKKIDRLFSQSGIKDTIKDEDIVAVKLHFGELGNTRYIRPIFARKIVDLVKEAGGRPFLTDTTTLYKRARHNLFDYLDAAAKNGFTTESMGCPILIADGLHGTNGKWIELDSFNKFKRVKVAQSIYEADFLISLAHITFHPETGFAGSVKNVAMGCATKETKLAMHSSEAKPAYNKEKCTLCLRCVKICPGAAFYEKTKQVYYQKEKCIGCGECISVCPSEAIKVPWASVLAFDVQKGIMDGFKGVTHIFGEKMAFINIGFDITSHCDCPGESELPVVPDIGILASSDAIACDKASYDLVTQAVAYPGSEVQQKGIDKDEDKIEPVYPDVDISRYWSLCKEAGLGNVHYELEVIS
ncbi:DUF362 domain-containing protein [Candidatus Aerophobetes bacterium]|nr:DUF362 domain-containing protein [Candidatus Aerophobetes bacterium]